MNDVSCGVECLEDGGYLLSDVATEAGDILSVYFGPCAVYALLPEDANAKALYPYLRELLGSVRVFLYADGLGHYDPYSGAFSDLCDEAGLLEEIYDKIYRAQPIYKDCVLDRMKDRLVQADAARRGYYRDNTGTLYLLRGGVFRRASERDSERIFRLCLYGGAFGLHRFALGRWFSGIVYLLTCGLFLTGWLVDLLQLFLGIQKDKDDSVLCPLEDKTGKLSKLPIGVAIAVLTLFLYFRSYQFFSFVSSQGLADFLNRTLGGLANSIKMP